MFYLYLVVCDCFWLFLLVLLKFNCNYLSNVKDRINCYLFCIRFLKNESCCIFYFFRVLKIM